MNCFADVTLPLLSRNFLVSHPTLLLTIFKPFPTFLATSTKHDTPVIYYLNFNPI